MPKLSRYRPPDGHVPLLRCTPLERNNQNDPNKQTAHPRKPTIEPRQQLCPTKHILQPGRQHSEHPRKRMGNGVVETPATSKRRARRRNRDIPRRRILQRTELVNRQGRRTALHDFILTISFLRSQSYDFIPIETEPLS